MCRGYGPQKKKDKKKKKERKKYTLILLNIILEAKLQQREAYRVGAPGSSPFVNARRIPLKSDGPKSPGGREAQLKGGKKTGRRKVSVTTRQEG